MMRSEVTHVVFEFATGAGWARRADWHAAQLVKLTQGVGRPLHLVLRAVGTKLLPMLGVSFRENDSARRHVVYQGGSPPAGGRNRYRQD